MKNITKMISLLFLIKFNLSIAQNSISYLNDITGIWKFEIVEEYESYLFLKQNKSWSISYWYKSNENAYMYGRPFSYFGFWDDISSKNQPQKIADLKSTGRYIFFYDDLIIPKKNKNNIGYDSFGNLYRPTRSGDCIINDEMPAGMPPTTLTMYLANNGKPDVYKKVSEIPAYVMQSLRKNKPDWAKYLAFMGHQEKFISSTKTYIYSKPNIPTKMYLVKGNEVEVLEQKGNWIRIRYYGKKTIEGWVKKEDVE